MRTSATAGLSKPQGDAKIPRGTLAYIRTRVRQRVYDLVVREFKKSGIIQAQLARRLDKAQDVVSRLLSRPSNMELDTLAELMFGMSGAVPAFTATYPLNTSGRDFSTETSTSVEQKSVDLTPSPPGEFKMILLERAA